MKVMKGSEVGLLNGRLGKVLTRLVWAREMNAQWLVQGVVTKSGGQPWGGGRNTTNEDLPPKAEFTHLHWPIAEAHLKGKNMEKRRKGRHALPTAYHSSCVTRHRFCYQSPMKYFISNELVPRTLAGNGVRVVPPQGAQVPLLSSMVS